MRALMMERPLLISSILAHAEATFTDHEVVTRSVEGAVVRTTYGGLAGRARQLANALLAAGIKRGDRVGTIAWNTQRHLEIYYAVSGIGAVCHTMNPRLHPSQLTYIINHAEDRILFVDLTFLPLLEAVAEAIATVGTIVVMTDREHMPQSRLEGLVCYEDLVHGHSDRLDWPELDENTASSLCYTSGTTGNPKGVLYSHRSTVLHSYGVALPDVFDLSSRAVVLPVVPQFHVNAWGIPYAAPMTGTKLVMPGPKLDGASLTELMAAEGVTMAAGVPTVWMGLIAHWRQTGTRVPTLKRIVVGGSAAPRAMLDAFQTEFGIEARHAWGMTEMSPLGTTAVLDPAMDGWGEDDRAAIRGKQGRPVFGVEVKIVDESGKPLPWDGKAFGDLRVRGPWVAGAYYRLEESSAHDADGWFSTGDVATIDAHGYMNVTDRLKDLIKSGGEWISSIDLENLAAGHPDVAQAAVIAVPDERWGERPLLIAVARAGTSPGRDGLLAFFAGKVPKFWVPDDVVFVDALPLGATGKVLKSRLREEHGRRRPG